MVFSLEKYRVICFGTAAAAPNLSRVFADMGAEVIKVESREGLDGIRMGRPLIGDDVAGGDEGKWPDLQPAFHNFNRNKRGITLNIKTPEGLEIIKKLIKISDVVCDNFRANLLKESGLGYQELAKIKPDIISISLTGNGEYGPLSKLPVYAPTITALGGLHAFVGEPGVPKGTLGGMYGDSNGSLHGVFAVLVALYYRKKTGKGQHIDLAECQATTSNLGEVILDYAMNKRIGGPEGNYRHDFAPRNNYQCQGEDKWVSIAVKNEVEWDCFCKAIGNPAWTKEGRFSSKSNRWQNKEELDSLITNWTMNHSNYEVMELLQNAGIAAVPLMNIEDEYFDLHFRERGTFIETQHPLIGMEPLYGLPWKMSKTPGEIYRHAPSLGEDNNYVFNELLGISLDEIAKLKEKKIIY